MGIFPDTQGQLTPQSLVKTLPNFELIRDFIVVFVTCKNEEDPIKNEGTSVHNVFSIITLWELSVAMEPEFQSELAQNLMQPFPHPKDASDKI